MCLILTVCCLTLPPFRRPSGLLFIFFLFFQDGLALITFTIEQPGSPHSRPGFPPSLCYICQAHGLSFAWTFSSSSMWPRTSTNRAGNRPQSSSSCTRWGGQCGPWPHHLPGAPRCSWDGLSEVVFLESTWTVDPTDWAGSRCQWQLFTRLVFINVCVGLLKTVAPPQVVGELSQLPPLPLVHGAKKDEEPNEWLVSISNEAITWCCRRLYLKVVVLMNLVA